MSDEYDGWFGFGFLLVLLLSRADVAFSLSLSHFYFDSRWPHL